MNRLLKITNGELELFASGSIIVNSDLPTTFLIEDNGPPLYFVLTFEYVSTESKTKHEIRKMNPINGIKSFGLALVNFNNVLGTYSQVPLLIGIAYGRELFFSYAVYALQLTQEYKHKQKKIDYSFFIGKEVARG